jgi:hypothetical protein
MNILTKATVLVLNRNWQPINACPNEGSLDHVGLGLDDPWLLRDVASPMLRLGMPSYYQRLRCMSRPKAVWYRREQLSKDACDRWMGHTPYGRMFSKFSKWSEGSRFLATSL